MNVCVNTLAKREGRVFIMRVCASLHRWTRRVSLIKYVVKTATNTPDTVHCGTTRFNLFDSGMRGCVCFLVPTAIPIYYTK